MATAKMNRFSSEAPPAWLKGFMRAWPFGTLACISVGDRALLLAGVFPCVLGGLDGRTSR